MASPWAPRHGPKHLWVPPSPLLGASAHPLPESLSVRLRVGGRVVHVVASGAPHCKEGAGERGPHPVLWSGFSPSCTTPLLLLTLGWNPVKGIYVISGSEAFCSARSAVPGLPLQSALQQKTLQWSFRLSPFFPLLTALPLSEEAPASLCLSFSSEANNSLIPMPHPSFLE